MSPVRYELGFYIPEDGILQVTIIALQNVTSQKASYTSLMYPQFSKWTRLQINTRLFPYVYECDSKYLRKKTEKRRIGRDTSAPVTLHKNYSLLSSGSTDDAIATNTPLQWEQSWTFKNVFTQIKFEFIRFIFACDRSTFIENSFST
jgi:hypothetical protein